MWPETLDHRDWCHNLANVLDKLPKRLQAQAKPEAKGRPRASPSNRLRVAAGEQAAEVLQPVEDHGLILG